MGGAPHHFHRGGGRPDPPDPRVGGEGGGAESPTPYMNPPQFLLGNFTVPTPDPWKKS